MKRDLKISKENFAQLQLIEDLNEDDSPGQKIYCTLNQE